MKCKEKYHENELLDYYCQKCKVCICDKCGRTRHIHHTKVDIQQAAEEQKEKIEEVLQEMKAKIDDHEKHANGENNRIVKEKQRKDCRSP